MPVSLEEVRIQGLPPSAFYIADFISIEEEQSLLDKITSAPKPRWKQLSKRRLQTWPSGLTQDTLLEASLPIWLTDPIVSRLMSLPLSRTNSTHIFGDSPHSGPNHVLINEYLPGEGIMPHKDGAAYHPVVCTVSLGSSLCLGIYESKDDGTTETTPRWRILQEPRSLLITTHEIYTDYLHGIAETTEDVDLGPDTIANWNLLSSTDGVSSGKCERQTRTSLTYRDVIRVIKLGTKFAMFRKR